MIINIIINIIVDNIYNSKGLYNNQNNYYIINKSILLYNEYKIKNNNIFCYLR